MGSLLPQAVFDRLRAMASPVKAKRVKSRSKRKKIKVEHVGLDRVPVVKVAEPRVVKMCQQCSIPIPPRRQKFCSDRCERRRERLRWRLSHPLKPLPLLTRNCGLCDKQFETTESSRLYCSSYCRDRRSREADMFHNKTNRLKIDVIKANSKCGLCDEDHPACLDFHHRDPETKKFSVADATRNQGFTWEVIQAEINKCDIICSNCHRKEHWDNPIASDIRMEKETNVRK